MSDRKEYKRQWYLHNREQVKIRSREYQRKRRAEDLEYKLKGQAAARAWKKTEFGRAWCAAYTASRRRKEEELSGGLTAEQRLAIFDLFHNCCVRCGSQTKLEIDHFRPLSKGFALIPNNAIVLCCSCNRRKYIADPEDFFTKKELCRIYEIQGKKF